MRVELTLHLTDEETLQAQKQASAHGISIEDWVRHVVSLHAPAASIAHLQETNPEEWARQFEAWARSHDTRTPLLSDEAISRDGLYPDRI